MERTWEMETNRCSIYTNTKIWNWESERGCEQRKGGEKRYRNRYKSHYGNRQGKMNRLKVMGKNSLIFLAPSRCSELWVAWEEGVTKSQLHLNLKQFQRSQSRELGQNKASWHLDELHVNFCSGKSVITIPWIHTSTVYWAHIKT